MHRVACVVAWVTAVLLGGCAIGLGPLSPGRMHEAKDGTPFVSGDEVARSGLTQGPYVLRTSMHTGGRLGFGRMAFAGRSAKAAGFESGIDAGLVLPGNRLAISAAAFMQGLGGDSELGVSFFGFGATSALRVAIAPRLTLRGGGGLLFGDVKQKQMATQMEAEAGTSGWLALGGLDWSMFGGEGSEWLLSLELRHFATGEVTLFESGSVSGDVLMVQIVWADF